MEYSRVKERSDFTKGIMGWGNATRRHTTRRHTPLSGSGFYNSSLRLDVVLISHSAPSLTDSQRTVVLLQQKGRTHGWVDVGLDEVTRFCDDRDSDDFI